MLDIDSNGNFYIKTVYLFIYDANGQFLARFKVTPINATEVGVEGIKILNGKLYVLAEMRTTSPSIQENHKILVYSIPTL